MISASGEFPPQLGAPFALDQFPEALASVRNGQGIKVQVAPGSQEPPPAGLPRRAAPVLDITGDR
jgi:hypothetical protein